MRLIDADALKHRLECIAYDEWNQGILAHISDVCYKIIEMIEEEPTIEPDREERE